MHKLFSFYKIKSLFLMLLVSLSTLNGQSKYLAVDIDTIKYSLDDFGKMWTFDNIPIKYFEGEYGFKPTQEWLEDVQKSALQFGNGCSASFVSEDGLIMTNHHCGRGEMVRVQKEGEDILKNGFYAATLGEERKAEGLFVDQLVLIVDVTERVNTEINKGINDADKVKNRNNEIVKIENEYSTETGLTCKVVTLYNGGKYSLYGYKRYNDVRLVFAPEFQIASTGWDWDNFTYPRYELDFAFFRAYDENGIPVKSPNYFNWSKNGAAENELIFTVGRPGSTNRIDTYSQLLYLKNTFYKNGYTLFSNIYDAYAKMYEKYPERESELLNIVMSIGNAKKSYGGTLDALHNPVLMAKKIDLEKFFKEKVNSDETLKEKYGYIWDALDKLMRELAPLSTEATAFRSFSFGAPFQFGLARKLVQLAEEMELPDDQRKADYKSDKLQSTIESLFPVKIDEELNHHLMTGTAKTLNTLLGNENPIMKKVFEGKDGVEAADIIFKKSILNSKESVLSLAKSSSQDILNSNDPFISLILHSRERINELQSKMNEINNTQDVLNQKLGEALFEVFGDSIPPDATSTLRISDGVIKRYPYNGTIAQPFCTIFGLYDRYYGFGEKTYPWGLPKSWQTIPNELDMRTPMSFASTNDIVGGNSGSAMINANAEIIGIAHDGNYESLEGAFIYNEYMNRTVGSDSRGMMESLKYIYKTERLVKELLNGSMK